MFVVQSKVSIFHRIQPKHEYRLKGANVDILSAIDPPKYDDLFSDDIEKLVKLGRLDIYLLKRKQ